MEYDLILQVDNIMAGLDRSYVRPTMPFVCVCRATQSLIFEVGVKDIVESVLDGYNGSIIASGQTGKDGLV